MLVERIRAAESNEGRRDDGDSRPAAIAPVPHRRRGKSCKLGGRQMADPDSRLIRNRGRMRDIRLGRQKNCAPDFDLHRHYES